ncbi:amphi-Trp domain-containing protein, partial [Streptomyces hydrogenans]|uniref:amphi-Trp domain-containing protein n=1 Tax=Streptomyces hydrogenans TaxID=1873719 RepID=UPI0035E03C8F
MKDFKYERKRSLSRADAADQLSALADALRKGGEAELELGGGVLNLRIPDDLRGEIELSVEDGEIEIEVELKWPIRGTQKAVSKKPVQAKVVADKKASDKPADKASAKKEPAKEPVKKAPLKAPEKKAPAKTKPADKALAKKALAKKA